MKKEVLYVVDKNGKVIGKESRKVLHQSPNKIHPVAHVLILNSKKEILVQKRAESKQFGAGDWDISAGGHVRYGEDQEKTAHKELKEELGVDVKLNFLTKKLFRFDQESELAYLYVGFSDGQFEIFEEEVQEVAFVPLEKLQDFLENNKEKSMLELWFSTISQNWKKIVKWLE